MASTKLRDELAANTVLGIAAHPDDLDFTAAGTLARLAAEGATVHYLILTDGSKGSEDPDITTERLVRLRQEEQRQAARLLGVHDVLFLDYEDGALEVNQALKKDLVRRIRQLKPDVVMAFDPTMAYVADMQFVNHPDHRACGQAVLDAVFPLARDHLTFPELNAEGLGPHKVKTLLLTNFEKQRYFVDISDTFETKLQAIAAHVSQVPDLAGTRRRMEDQAAAAGRQCGCRYAEGFVRIDVGV